jgi:hypothetical protein
MPRDSTMKNGPDVDAPMRLVITHAAHAGAASVEQPLFDPRIRVPAFTFG